jgi:hypothetical protein
MSKIRIESDSIPIEIIDDIMVDIYKQKSSFERLKIAFGLWNSARTQLFHNLRSIRPDWDEEHIRREVAKRISHGAT